MQRQLMQDYRKTPRDCARPTAGDRGFTLVELLIVVTILPLVVGAISVGLVSVLSMQSRTSSRLSGSGDLQTVSATFVKDVQSAESITTSSQISYRECGTAGTQLLGLVWSQDQSAVSYVSVPVNNGTTNYSLERLYCTSGNFSTPSATTVISYDLSGTQSPPSICAPTTSSCAVAQIPPTSASTIAAVVFSIYVPMNSAPYTMEASPRAGGNNQGGTPGGKTLFPPFALLGTGCTGPVLSVGNGSLSINVNSGSNNGQLGVMANCPNSITLANGGSINASSILTADPGLNSVSTGENPGYYPAQYGWTAPSDPLASLVPPQQPDSSQGVSCTYKRATVTYKCPPGYYATDPGFKNNSTIIFSGGGNYYFAQDFTLPNGTTTTFSTGAYIFGAADNAAFTTGASSVSITTNNALLYSPNGSMTFGNGAVVSLTAPTSWLGSNNQQIPSQGVALWDAAPYTPSYCGPPLTSQCVGVLTLSNNGTQTTSPNLFNTYGGIYAPKGELVDNNNGGVNVSFIIVAYASLGNGNAGTVINITSP